MIELVDVRLDHPRGGAPLVSGANLRVTRGEIVLVVGAAGVGTSRIVSAALGEVPPSAGRVEILGRDVSKLRRSSLRLMRRRVGIVPQELCLLEDRTAQLNVMMPLEIDGIPRAVSMHRADAVLERLDLGSEANAMVDTLSTSARQRVAVARALVRDPELVLADQPTSLQDPSGMALVCRALAERAQAGGAVIVLSRDPRVSAIADHWGWRQFDLAAGVLAARGVPHAAAVPADEMFVDIDTAPTPRYVEDDAAIPQATDDVISNVVPFPIPARTAGMA